MLVRSKYKPNDKGRVMKCWCDFTDETSPFGITCEANFNEETDAISQDKCLVVERSYCLKKYTTTIVKGKRHFDMCHTCFEGLLGQLNISYHFD